jgi:multidrug efflux pump subunit AcrA (membrane-fusion protein)
MWRLRRRSARDDKYSTISLEASRIIRRQRVFLACAVAAALLALGGLGASLLVKSPAQRAAEQGPPQASVLTAPVLKEVLKSNVVVRGTVVSTGTVAVSPAGASADSSLVLSGLAKPAGSTVNAGDVIAQISGRPLIALVGTVPAYRDLKPGETGPDVAQLQNALALLGYPTSDSSGNFGSGTREAVTKFYNARGYDPVMVDSVAGVSGTTPLQDAQRAVTLAQRALTSDSVAAAAAAPGAAQTAAKQQVSNDQQDLATAKSALANLQAQSGAEVPMGEVVFVSSLPAVVSAVNAAIGANLSGLTEPLLTIDVGQLAVTATVPSGEQQLIKVGLGVTIDDDVNLRQAEGKVASLGAFSASTPVAGQTSSQNGADAGGSASAQDQSSPGYPLSVRPTGMLDPSWRGADVRLTITTAATPQAVLVVPLAAIYSTADGTTTVLVAGTGHAVARRVIVTVGSTSAGLAQVTPSQAGLLAPGDLVVTGK